MFLTFEPTDTIKKVKEHLQETIGVEVAMIRILYKRKQLNDEQTLEHYQVTAGNAINMGMMLRGGQ